MKWYWLLHDFHVVSSEQDWDIQKHWNDTKGQYVQCQEMHEHCMTAYVYYMKMFFFSNFIFKLYIIVLVLPNIKMNPPQGYMCSPSWTLLPPPSPYHPSGSSQCTSPKHPVSCIEPGLATHLITIFYCFAVSEPRMMLTYCSFSTLYYLVNFLLHEYY